MLFLRPTESLTVFLQQFGRGLRLHPEKECLTVLDFIGQAHENYNHEMRFRALMDSPKHRIDEEIERGCVHLPLGCVIQLERVAQQHILNNIRAAISHSKSALLRQVRTFEEDTKRPLTLTNFLSFYRLEPDNIYRRSTWSQICAEAGRRPHVHDPDTIVLSKGLRRIAHINSVRQIEKLQHLMSLLLDDLKTTLETDSDAKHRLQIAICSLLSDMEEPDPYDGMVRLKRNPTLCAELRELFDARLDSVEIISPTLQLPFECPLDLHSSYTLDEALTALGYETAKSRRSVRQGVVHVPTLCADAFFVTLNKSETDYSPTTMYEDYAISETLFHWQSQSTTSETSETGKRYINQKRRGYTPLLFVREEKSRDNYSCPYFFLGPLEYMSHTGSRPMSIIWKLQYPIPARILAVARRMLAA